MIEPPYAEQLWQAIGGDKASFDAAAAEFSGVAAHDPAGAARVLAELEARLSAVGAPEAASRLQLLSRIMNMDATRFRARGGPLAGMAPPAASPADVTRLRPARPQAAAIDPTRVRSAPPAPHGVSGNAGSFASPTAPDTAGFGLPTADWRPEQNAVIRDRYVLEQMIGQGGMGQVWRARDRLLVEADDPHPYVAVKLLNSDFEVHPDSYIALQREGGRAQQLAHPNIATVFSFDRDASNGKVFLTMELLEGQPLDAIISEHGTGMERRRAMSLIKGMAAGLAYAHKRGVVHSDFKPGNVFVVGEDVAKVLDFGIARVIRGSEAERRVDTFDAGRLSARTPAYASAEMIAGADPSASDDVYALGLVAWELMSGRHPYNRMPASEARSAHAKPTALKGVSRREHRVLMRAIAFDSANRWPDAGAFLRALQGINAWIPALSAAAVVLAGVAGVVGYRDYRASLPDVPFEQLPAATRQKVTTYLLQAGQDRELYQSDKSDLAGLVAIVEDYAGAYQEHPRNQDAVKGLKWAAEQAIGNSLANPEFLAGLRDQCAGRGANARCDFYADYAPLLDAIKGRR